MSAFGDGTPKQDLMDAIYGVQDEHKLSYLELVKLLSEILAYLLKYFV
jgi:hypothetical protein